MEDTNYLMNTGQALELALHNEIRGRDFYAWVAESTPDPEVRRIAEEMAEEEREHVALLKKWLTHERPKAEEPLEDLDPPNIPE
jgi:rubrerythrin